MPTTTQSTQLLILLAIGTANMVVYARGCVHILISIGILGFCIMGAFTLGQTVKKKRVRFSPNLVQEHRI
jgi:hypothetical protein